MRRALRVLLGTCLGPLLVGCSSGPDPGTCVTSGLGTRSSAQKVVFTVRNASAQDRFLVTTVARQGLGPRCDLFAITRNISGMPPSVTAIDYAPPPHCEGPPPVMPVAYVRRLLPNESESFVWDAREVLTCTLLIDCEQMGWSGRGSYVSIEPYMSPVPSGNYEVVFRAATQPPTNCALFGSTYQCTIADASVCSDFGTIQAMASFTIPASGDARVDVPLL